MSTLTYSYPTPYKLPAGIMALVVHAAFFALLYFGIDWHNEQPQGMVVDIWDGLPAPQLEHVKVTPPPESPHPVELPKPLEPPKLAQPAPIPKAEIALPEKNKPKIKTPEPVKPIEDRPVKPKKTEPVPVDQKTLADKKAQLAQATQAEQQRAAQVAATGKMVDEYKLKIIAKIRRNIVMPPDVQDGMRAEFNVILLPGGSVLSATLVKPSGSGAYDDAVERAISKAQPLPLPADVALFNRFRELHLIFTPKE